MSVQSNFKTTTTQSLGNSTTTDLDIYLDTLPNSSTGYLVLDPEGSNYELIYYESKDAATGKVTCPAANGRALSLTATTRTTVAGNVKSHGPGTVVIMAPDHLTLSNLELNKLDVDGGNVSDSFDAEDSNNEWRIRNNAGVMELRDKNTATVTLAELAAAAGTDQKVKVSIDDTTSGLVEDKFVAGTNTTVSTNNAGGNETFQYNAAGTLASIVTDVTATSAEINQALDGIDANVTAANLIALVGGGDVSGLHSHTASTRSFTALEAVAQGDALALISNEVKHFSQLTDANLALGDANARRRYAIKVTPTRTTNSLTTMRFRGKEINGGSTLNLSISIQGDNAGEPDGVTIANGAANNIAVSGWGTSYSDRTATWAASPTLTEGTPYWIVFSVDGTEAAEGIHLSVNSSHDENYNTFTRLTYDLDTATWGNSATNATPFFWFNSQEDLLGVGVVKTDANHPNRTWNFIGFAKDVAAANASVAVYTDAVPGLSGLSRRKNYYISTTAGEITTSKPNNRYNGLSTTASYKIGRALDDGTTLKIELGEKMIWHTESGSATTATDFVTWFDLDRIEIWGGFASASTLQQGMGVYDKTYSYCAYMASDDGGAETTGVDTNSTLGDGDSYPNRFAGAMSSVNDGGFTHTMTETGTSTYSYMMRIYG